MLDFTFESHPVQLFFGENKLNEVINQIKSYGPKVMLVFGGASFMKNGYYQTFIDALEQNGMSHIDFHGNTSPSLNKVREGIKICRDENVNSVIGIGGGTCMDIAKAIAFGTLQEEDIWQYLTYELSEEGQPHLPIGTIVTYPSSGSEVNGALQIDNDETQVKVGLASVYPDFTWLNPDYMMSIGSTQLAYGQMTSFVQGSSQFISLEEAELTESMLAALLQNILSNLKESLEYPDNKESRGNLMLTSTMGMLGFTSFGKTGDWTLMPLTGMLQTYLDIPYTKALTIVFPYFLKDIYDGDRVFKSYFQNVLGLDITDMSDTMILEEGLNKLWNIYRQLGIATTFQELTELPQTHQALFDMLDDIEDMPSQYGTFTAQRLRKILLESMGK